MADARHPSGDGARRCHDAPYLDRDRHPAPDRVATRLAFDARGGAGKFASALAANYFRGVHWLLYVLVLATTLTGWFFASMRGWSISFFFAFPLPMLTTTDSPLAGTIGRWHKTAEWTLLIVVGLHVAAAFAHLIFYKDRVMQRMLPGVGAS